MFYMCSTVKSGRERRDATISDIEFNPTDVVLTQTRRI